MVNQKAFKYTNLSEYNIIYLTSTCYYWGLFVIQQEMLVMKTYFIRTKKQYLEERVEQYLSSASRSRHLLPLEHVFKYWHCSYFAVS